MMFPQHADRVEWSIPESSVCGPVEALNTMHTIFDPSYLLAIGMPGPFELIIILVIGLLIFGRRLPEVGRSVGRSIVEFKKGVKGIEDEVDQANRLADLQNAPVMPPSMFLCHCAQFRRACT